MLDLKPQILRNLKIQLEPLQESHRNELYLAANDKSIWTYQTYDASGEQFTRWFERALKDFSTKTRLPFIVRKLDDMQIIGSTSYYEINAKHHRLAIGYTWYTPLVWGTYVNPASKWLLLQYAFELNDVNRVELLTDSRNMRSRAAIKKLGAKEEGVLRSHMVLDCGYIRDSVVFSIIKSDWLEVGAVLQKRI
jgi:RimJ/RimL family protein N-acetyltransferase